MVRPTKIWSIIREMDNHNESEIGQPSAELAASAQNLGGVHTAAAAQKETEAAEESENSEAETEHKIDPAAVAAMDAALKMEAAPVDVMARKPQTVEELNAATKKAAEMNPAATAAAERAAEKKEAAADEEIDVESLQHIKPATIASPEKKLTLMDKIKGIFQ